MKLHLSGPPKRILNSSLNITGSKSESNRLLLLQARYPNIRIENLSNSDDASVMQRGLQISKGEVDIHHAGTAMRFLTAYFATEEGKSVTLTGSQRMQERPVAVLVKALQELGAEITYTKNEGCPPILIRGKRLKKQRVSLPADISSQYISALLLVAPGLEEGLELELVGQITSIPYIKMTLGLLDQLGIAHSFEENIIKVQPRKTVPDTVLVVESDWSSASYFYSIVALCDPGTELRLSSYKKDSLQGDSILAEIYRYFGVDTRFGENSILLRKVGGTAPARSESGLPATEKRDYSADEGLELDLTNAPDLAQTITVTCFGLGLGCDLTGLHTLKIKETDRLEALKHELTKLGARISVTHKSLHLEPSKGILKEVAIDTYNDHRMAMAFAPLALRTSLYINDAEVVSKSYPDYWKDLQFLQFQIKTC